MDVECHDRNKSSLTHEVTAATSAWLDGHGFKPVETEVPVAVGWCADLAGVICPTQTEMIGLKLLKRPPSWNERHSQSVARRIWNQTQYAEWNTERKALNRVMTCCVEVKTSRADYRGYRKWVIAQPTDLAYVAYPKGMVQEVEWPEGWGILEYSDAGIQNPRPPVARHVDPVQQRDVILNIAVRRDHHTRYARWREFQKRIRAEEGETKRIQRLEDIARFVLDIVQNNEMYGDDLEKSLRCYGFKNLSSRTIERLQTLWAMRTKACTAASPAISRLGLRQIRNGKDAPRL